MRCNSWPYLTWEFDLRHGAAEWENSLAEAAYDELARTPIKPQSENLCRRQTFSK
jgi:hypothetical protein